MDKATAPKKRAAVAAVCAAAFVACLLSSALFMKKCAKKNRDSTEPGTLPLYSDGTFCGGSDDISETAREAAGGSARAVREPSATLKRAAGTAKRKAKAGRNKPTRKPGDGPEATQKQDGLIRPLLSEKAILGYRYSPDGDYYYTDDKDYRRKRAGYNEMYDRTTPPTAMFIDAVRIGFPYEGKDWMIRFWKGQYGNLFVGAETGVYTAPEGTYKGEPDDANRYDCAAEEDWLKMQLDCYWSGNDDGHYRKIFTRKYDRYRWATGFVKGRLTKYTAPRTELKVKARITFKSEEMADLFVGGLQNAGFNRSVGENNLVDDGYFQKGADVWLLWWKIYQESFEGYEGRTTTAKPTTTEPATTKPTTTEPATTKPTTAKPATTPKK